MFQWLRQIDMQKILIMWLVTHNCLVLQQEPNNTSQHNVISNLYGYFSTGRRHLPLSKVERRHVEYAHSSRPSRYPCCYRQTTNHCITTSHSPLLQPLKCWTKMGKFLQNRTFITSINHRWQLKRRDVRYPAAMQAPLLNCQSPLESCIIYGTPSHPEKNIYRLRQQ